MSLLTNPPTLDWVIAILTGTVTSATGQSVKSRPAIQSTLMGASSANLLPMQQIEQISSTLSSGQVNSVSIISDAATTLSFQLLVHATDMVFRAQDPAGMTIDCTTPASNSNVQYSVMMGCSNLMLTTCMIANPTTGTWQAVLDGSSMSETGVSLLLKVFGDSTVSLLPQTIPPCNQGQDVVVSCALADLSTNPAIPVVNAFITVTILLPDGTTNSLRLFDDGWHNDGAPNDGVYAAVLTNVQQAGSYSIAYRATGTNAQGQALQRVATGGFSVSSGNGSVLGDPVYENLDTDGDGYADYLEVKCWVNPTTNGNYILAGDLVDASGTNRFSQSASFTADGSGPMQVALIFDLATIRAGGVSGDLHIENLQLFEETGVGTAWLDTYRGSSVVSMPDANPLRVWLAAHSLPSDGSADYADSDGDGMNNWQEYVAGTDPTDSNSFLSITAISNLPPSGVMGFVIQWSSITGKWYSLDRSTNLLSIPPFDFNVRSNIPSTPPLNTETDTTIQGQGPYFYRIGVQ